MFINKKVNENFSDIINRTIDKSISVRYIEDLVIVEVELLVKGEIKYLFKGNDCLMKIKTGFSIPTMVEIDGRNIMVITDVNDGNIDCLSINIDTLEVVDKTLKRGTVLKHYKFISDTIFSKKNH